MNWVKSFWQSLVLPPAPEGITFSDIQNFTPRAQQVLNLARKEAERFQHNFVGTEHLLLGLLRLGQGTAVSVLTEMGVDLDKTRQEVEKHIGVGPDQKPIGQIPYTPRVRKVFALASKEAKALSHTYVGTEHLLLGLIREGDGLAARVLTAMGLDTSVVRNCVLRELDPNYSAKSQDLRVAQDLPSESERNPVGTQKRYDIHCGEGDQEIIYCGARFKGVRTLFQQNDFEIFADFIEVEQSNGKIVFLARHSITKFAETEATPHPGEPSA